MVAGEGVPWSAAPDSVPGRRRAGPTRAGTRGARERMSMKIVKIDNLLMRVERQNWHFVKVTTDDGIVGVGEASVEGRERTVAAAVDEFSRYLIGEDPGPIEHHWQRLHRHGFWGAGSS